MTRFFTIIVFLYLEQFDIYQLKERKIHGAFTLYRNFFEIPFEKISLCRETSLKFPLEFLSD